MKVIREEKYIVPNNEQGKEFIDKMKPSKEEYGSWSAVDEIDSSLVLTITKIQEA